MFKGGECVWPEDLQQRLFKDVGWHCAQANRVQEALQLFQQSINISKTDDVYFKRSDTYYNNIDIEEALEDAQAGLKLNNIHYRLNLLENNCIFDQNEFERNCISVSNKVAHFDGFRKEIFHKYNRLNKANYANTIGKYAGRCLYDQKRVFDKLPKKVDPNKRYVPMWRELQRTRECDVLSIRDIQAKKLQINDIIQEEQRYKAFTQKYLDKSWQDIFYLRQLCSDQRIYCYPLEHIDLKKEMQEYYKKAWRCTKMLHARKPVYSKRIIMFGNNKTRERNYREQHLFRVQYATRRDVFNQLEDIRRLAHSGDKAKFCQYTKRVLGVYYQLKSYRVFPRKVEFVNEICNIVALFYINRLKPLDIDIDSIDTKEECLDVMAEVLDIPVDNSIKLEGVAYVFGDESTFREIDQPDIKYKIYKTNLDFLDHRIQNSKYAIERCYLYNEITLAHLNNQKTDEARIFAKKTFEQATDEACDSPIWQYLALLALVICHLKNSNCDKIREHLNLMISVAERLNSEFIDRVNSIAYILNDKLSTLNIVAAEDI